jgi:hypothetical protein
MKTILLSASLFLGVCTHLFAQNNSPLLDTRVNVLFGLNQPLLNGFNAEVNLFYKRLAFDYSHGISLNLDNSLLDATNKALGLDVHIPWTTGFGVGYRFNDWFNLRAEPKWHKFELYHQGDAQTEANRIAAYTTFSLGIGAYANLRPFKKQDNFLKGIMVAPSIRWWPRVASSLDNNQLEFQSRTQNQRVTHEAMQVGISNTPLIVNISIGYSLGWKH